MESCFFCGKEVTSRAQKKRRRLLSGPQLDILKKLTSEFLEVDCSMQHTGYACRSCYDRVQTLTENLKNALPILPKFCHHTLCSKLKLRPVIQEVYPLLLRGYPLLLRGYPLLLRGYPLLLRGYPLLLISQ